MIRSVRSVSLLVILGLLTSVTPHKLAAKTTEPRIEAPAKAIRETKKPGTERMVGKVISMDVVNKGLVLADQNRGNVGININDSTKVILNKKQIAISEIKTGDKVSVYAKRNEQGGLTAQKVIIWKSSRGEKTSLTKLKVD